MISRLLLRPFHHSITEDHADLAILVRPFHRLQTGFLGGGRVDTLDVGLETVHQEEDAPDRDRPQHEHREQEHLVRREEIHHVKCLR